MIFIPKSFILILGGKSTKEVLIYDINNKKDSENWKNYPHLLPEELIEPSLIMVNSRYLFCFENISSLKILKADILTLGDFETIQINNGKKVEQQFFGVLQSCNNNILFLGGKMMDLKENEEKHYITFNFETNKLIPTQDLFKEYNLIEKTFVPINEKEYIQIGETKIDNKHWFQIILFPNENPVSNPPSKVTIPEVVANNSGINQI